MTIGSNLKRLRKEAKLSQAKLAALSKVSQQLISQIETDTNSSTKELPALAKALGVSVADIDESFAEGLLQPDFQNLTPENLEKLISINRTLEAFATEDDDEGLGDVLTDIQKYLKFRAPKSSDHKK